MPDKGKRILLVVMFCLGVLQAVAYYLAGVLSGSDGSFAIAQPDTLLYCQAARRIVEGHPFSFSAGTAVCTGTTSHLYPFLLAIPYWLGATENALFRLGFVLNALFYLLFLLGWWMVVCELVRTPFARMTAGLLVALFGQAAFSAFAQSDIGLWMMVSALFAAGIVRCNPWLYGPLLLLGPWVRPEGMICVVAFVGCAIVQSVIRWKWRALCHPSVKRRDLVWMILGITSMVGVFAFNFALTGKCQFSSVAHKGHIFLASSLASGISRTLIDFVWLAKSFLLGLPKGHPFDFYFVPILGAAVAWLGALTCVRGRKFDWRLFVWPLAVLGGLLSVASSGWMETNNYRYVAWLLPTMLVFAACGVDWLWMHFHPTGYVVVVSVVLVAYAGMGCLSQFCSFVCCVHHSSVLWPFANACEQAFDSGASVGALGDCGLAYGFSSRRLAHVSGIYSPEFFDGEFPGGKFEILKNEPTTRFDYWVMNADSWEVDMGLKPNDLMGQQMLVGPNGLELRHADWSRFDAAGCSPASPQTGLTLKARVDVAYATDEHKADYEIFPRYAHVCFHSFSRLGKLGKRDIIESGRLVVGQDEMTIPTEPGKDLAIVMRTGDECKAIQNGEFAPVARRYAFANPLKLNLQVDGVPAGMGVAPLATNAFSDVTFTIPGKFITKERSRIAFCGDHVAYAYWFYQ